MLECCPLATPIHYGQNTMRVWTIVHLSRIVRSKLAASTGLSSKPIFWNIVDKPGTNFDQ